MTRFTSQCDLRAELLSEYITASSEAVDSEVRLHSAEPVSAKQLAATLIDRALSRPKTVQKISSTTKAAEIGRGPRELP